ncbi:MAG: NAD(P)/FAD-dependent oxidoreductase [Saprospiraceae bacterium]|nr:NAD(P)/FAD-dependent oxidoreductase [Saprospiraceae bacterium]
MSLNIKETTKKRVVIVGAGFAGLSLARKLAKSEFEVVLLDRYNYHQFQPLFYQVAMAGLEPSAISFPLRKVFQKSKNVIIRICELESIDTEKNEVHTSLGSLQYDHLVLSMGATTNFFGNEELEKNALTMKSTEDALYLRNKILLDYESALLTADYDKRQGYIDIVIVGGGATGVELAGALAEMRNFILPKDYKELDNSEVDIYLIQSGEKLLQGMSEKSSRKALEFLQKIGVEVLLNTRVTSVDGEYVKTNTDKSIRAKKVIWAAGITCRTIEGLRSDCYCRGNRIAVDRSHLIKGYKNVYALGDLAFMEEEKYPNGHPQVAQVAIQQARNLAKILKGKSESPFSYKDLGSMATIGRNKAVVDLPSFSFTGFFAWIMWLIVHLASLIGVRNRFLVLFNWMWNYVTYDQSLRLIIRTKNRKAP